MWNYINTETDVQQFMNNMIYFHDSCIKEIKYISGAYVDEDLSMYPLNDKRILKVIIQRQFENNSMIELEFTGIKWLKLFPIQEGYTCEIFESTLLLNNSGVYWSDCGGMVEGDFEDYGGTSICASKLRWRAIDSSMGEKEFYVPVK
ncbi:MAG: hypothetical protein E7492_01445 [Ruminococcaceae bacterium]|nr:hypothetical protein [Oscillospiraceae bacterium]